MKTDDALTWFNALVALLIGVALGICIAPAPKVEPRKCFVAVGNTNKVDTNDLPYTGIKAGSGVIWGRCARGRLKSPRPARGYLT